MDLLVAQVNKSGVIESNLEAVEGQLNEFLDGYRGIIVTEDTLPQSKKDLAEIRKKKDSIDTARKELKKQWEAPFKEFEGKCKKLIELCDKTIDEINSQVKTFEDQKKEEKRKLISGIYENAIGEYQEFLPLEAIFDDKWLNVSTKQKDIEFDISEKKTHVMADINVIKALRSEIESDLLDTYKKSGNSLAAAVERNQQYMRDKATIEAKALTTEESVEKKPSVEAMGTLNDVVEAFKTVKFVISATDKEEVETILNFNGIKYQILED